MPSRPSVRAGTRRPLDRLIIACAVGPGLALGFFAGVELARAGAASQPTKPVRVHAAMPRLGSLETGEQPELAAAGAARQSRRSLKAGIESIDPATWLARFGEVEIVAHEPRP
jgi:hypothetical protein